MDRSRRRVISLLGTLAMATAGQTLASVTRQVKPRHVLCFLGDGARSNARIAAALAPVIAAQAPGFVIDETYSITERDPRMEESFAVCWDRVERNAYSDADVAAVANHQSVLYVLGPRMSQQVAVATSASALALVRTAIAAGAVAAKGESAGVAHGLSRWSELARLAQSASTERDVHALRRICRLAFAKRPLSSGDILESVGFHLVGLPEVYVRNGLGSEREVVAVMDAVADEISSSSITRVLEARRGRLTFESSYEPDDFKYNPYGTVVIDEP